MNPNELIVEARARIIWGEESPSVRCFLTSNGMSAADAQLAAFNRERNAEIRKLGFRNSGTRKRSEKSVHAKAAAPVN